MTLSDRPCHPDPAQKSECSKLGLVAIRATPNIVQVAPGSLSQCAGRLVATPYFYTSALISICCHI